MKKKLVQWIVINQQPFTTIQEPAFLEFIQTLAPDIKIPSATSIKTSIMDFYLND